MCKSKDHLLGFLFCFVIFKEEKKVFKNYNCNTLQEKFHIINRHQKLKKKKKHHPADRTVNKKETITKILKLISCSVASTSIARLQTLCKHCCKMHLQFPFMKKTP